MALSQNIPNLIPIQELLKEIMRMVFKKIAAISIVLIQKPLRHPLAATSLSSTINHSTVYEDNLACLKFVETEQLSPHTKQIGIP